MWVYEDDLVEFVFSIFTNPIGVQHFQVGISSTDPLFCYPLDRLRHCDFLDTGIRWLSLHVDFSFPETASPDSGSHEDNSLFRLVANSPSGVDTCWTFDSLEHALFPPRGHSVPPCFFGHAQFRSVPSRFHVLGYTHVATSGANRLAFPI